MYVLEKVHDSNVTVPFPSLSQCFHFLFLCNLNLKTGSKLEEMTKIIGASLRDVQRLYEMSHFSGALSILLDPPHPLLVEFQMLPSFGICSIFCYLFKINLEHFMVHGDNEVHICNVLK